MANLIVLDPTVSFQGLAKQARLAPRVNDLSGVVLGLLNHHGTAVSGSTPGRDPFFEALKAKLGQRYQLKGVVWRTKPNLSRMAPREMLEEIAAQADVVVNGTCS
ncbi:MAG: hypothetical protein HY684_05795 [Chloroflexi bacterium]|nr:hypothetical protein [Chloroflexota bacterium]